MPTVPTIQAGTCHALFAYDAAHSIDLEKAERRLGAAERQTVKQKRRAPASFEYRPAPLHSTVEADPITIAGFSSAATAEVVLYDFGAVSVSYAFRLSGTLDGLPALSEALYGNAQLLADSRRQAERLIQALGDAASRPQMAPFVEDYAVFEIESFAPSCVPADLWTAHAAIIARILRAEQRELSEQEITDATASRLSFGADDATFVATDAALVFDREGDDVRTVIELANTQLVELRYIDQQLDVALDRAYDMLSKQRGNSMVLGGRSAPNVRRLAELQLDSVVLFEQVSNALKLIGDQYLARVYGLVSQRFQLPRWDDALTRKLATIENIYGKMVDRSATRRMEVLEWIIIALFVISIVLPFLTS